MRTLDELRKEINGKQVVWVRGAGHEFGINAIILAPPEGSDIVVKPYDYEPEELVKIFADNGWDRTLRDVSRPTFCLSKYPIGYEDIENVLKKLVAIPDGGIHDCNEVLKENTGLGGAPSCPYG